jgi:hypothetical protein
VGNAHYSKALEQELEVARREEGRIGMVVVKEGGGNDYSLKVDEEGQPTEEVLDNMSRTLALRDSQSSPEQG